MVSTLPTSCRKSGPDWVAVGLPTDRRRQKRGITLLYPPGGVCTDGVPDAPMERVGTVRNGRNGRSGRQRGRCGRCGRSGRRSGRCGRWQNSRRSVRSGARRRESGGCNDGSAGAGPGGLAVCRRHRSATRDDVPQIPACRPKENLVWTRSSGPLVVPPLAASVPAQDQLGTAQETRKRRTRVARRNRCRSKDPS
jgi:hypothetical protein